MRGKIAFTIVAGFVAYASTASADVEKQSEEVYAAVQARELLTDQGAGMWRIRENKPGTVENGAGVRLEWSGATSRDQLDVFDYFDGDLKVRISAWRYLPGQPPQPVDTYTVDLGWGIGRVRPGVSLAKAEEIAANIRAALLVWSKGVICNAEPPIKKVVFDMLNWSMWPVGRQLP